VLPLARPVAVVHGYSRLPHFLPLPFDNCGEDQTGTTHRGDISREGGLVVGPSNRPCHSRDRLTPTGCVARFPIFTRQHIGHQMSQPFALGLPSLLCRP
jgi:hypothetical protein